MTGNLKKFYYFLFLINFIYSLIVNNFTNLFFIVYRSKEIPIQLMYDDLKRMTFSHRNVIKSNKYGL